MLKRLFLTSIIILISIFVMDTSNISSSISTPSIIKNGSIPNELPIATLSIDKININKPIYKLDSSNNTVEKNVELLHGSIFPDKSNSIIFLAAHSGNSNVSYFNDLDKLNKGDEINFYYKNKKYVYIVDNKFLEDKDGDIEINKSSNNQLVLTTCSRADSKKQLIINSNLKR